MSVRPRPDPRTMPDEVLKRMNISREDYVARRDVANEAEKHVPNVGDRAPDFEIERLDAKGRRTGDYVKLSDSSGRPVVLYFGSYT